MGVASASKQKGPRFDENYRVSWGQDHVKSSIQGREVQISLDKDTGNHNELDFEFLGNRQGKPYLVQTNVFVNGKGDREQRVRLWFDPTAAFHGYSILWNQHQVV
ncbi:unnamed protein product [Ilex paraguariensis]|uniref:GH16 domain-containing protein n=1 Tax=Ilex paraguariensis TaxID=185542 RepID=A0ABC8QUX7_9AQUA